MKKKLFILVSIMILGGICFSLLLFNRKDGILLCTSTVNNGDVIIKNSFEVLYKDRNVVSVKSSEEITADDSETIEQYKDLLESMYEPYNKIEYYSNEIKVENKTLKSITKINYNKINKDELIAVDRSNSSLYEGNKVPIKKLKKVYKDMGARCKNK